LTLISQAGEALVREYTGGQANIFRTLVELALISAAGTHEQATRQGDKRSAGVFPRPSRHASVQAN